MKSYIFKIAHQQTKQVIQAGDNYQVTFGAVLKRLYKRVRFITRHVAPIIEQGFTSLTVESRAWNASKKSAGTGGYCLTLKSKNQECNITRFLNESSNGKSFYMTHDAKAKTLNGSLAIVIINHLTK